MIRKPGRLLVAVLLGYLILTLGYGVVNPLFEAPDEQHHYFTAQFIADTGRLPSVDRVPDDWMGQEAAQPPLYYLVGSFLIAPIDTDRAKGLVWNNPHAQLGDASSPTNTNAFVHTSVEKWPWRGYVLAAHVLRAFSTLIGLGTLLCLYGSGRLAWPDRPERALLATALVAFLPQFNFLHGSISNDNLVIFFCVFALWQLLRLWYDGLSWFRFGVLGVTLGLAILSKMAGLLLLAYSVGFLIVLVSRDYYQDNSSSLGVWSLRIGVVIGLTLAVAGWLLWRNWNLYGEITGSSQFVRMASGDRGFTLGQVLAESDGLWLSLFAVFGWFNLRPPGWIYLIWNGLAVAAVLGAAWTALGTYRRIKPTAASARQLLPTLLAAPWLPAVLLAGWLFLVYAGLVQFLLRTPAAQGRLLYPALVPLALGLAYGLDRFAARLPLAIRALHAFFPALALLTSLYILAAVIPSAYARPPVITTAEIPTTAARLDTDLGRGLTLLAAEVETDTIHPGDLAWLTLYWRADTDFEPAPAREDLLRQAGTEFVLEVFGREETLVGKLQSYHGGGLFPAELWPIGPVIVDRLGLRIFESAVVPVQAHFNLKLLGETASVDVGVVKVAPHEWPSLVEAPAATLEGIELVEVHLDQMTATPGDAIGVAIRWQVQVPPGRDLTTFVHLGDPAQAPLAQGDSPPLSGAYPTSLWAAGEVIDDRYTLVVPADLPPGRYPVHIGLYDAVTGTRVPLTVNSLRQPSDAFPAGSLNVQP